MSLCYILDGILIIYGIILTVLYCRLKIHSPNNGRHEKTPVDGGIYAGLTVHSTDTYETLDIKKKPIV